MKWVTERGTGAREPPGQPSTYTVPMNTAAELISVDPEVMSGTPVFAGTRVPVQTLVDYLAAGDPLEEFLEDFPTVTRETARLFIQLASEEYVERHGTSAA